PALGLDRDRLLPGQPVVVDVLADAADAVAAHRSLGAVGVEHDHPEVGLLRGGDQDEAVGADAGVAVADRDRQRRGIGDLLLEGVDVDVVVAGAVHLGEFHGPTWYLCRSLTSTRRHGYGTAVTLTVGIDEVGYGPKLGPLVVAAASASRPLPAGVVIGDSKKVFSQQKGIETLEPAVLGFLRAATFADLLAKLSAPMPCSPW